MKRCSVIFLYLIFVISINFGQVKFSAGPLVGLSIPTGDYGGTTIDFYNGARYGLGTGFTLGAIFKAKFTVVGLRVGATYSAFSNTGLATPDRPTSYVQVKQSNLILSVGPEFKFNLSNSPVQPYVGIDLLITSFSGETTFNSDVPRVDPGTYQMSGTTRAGLGFGAGAEFNLGKSYALDFGIRYNLLNLFGKTYTPGVTNGRIYSYLALNDDADPSFIIDPDHHPISSSRSISVLQLNLAFLFNF